MQPNKTSLKYFSFAAKILATCYIASFILGYGVALLQAADRSHMNMQNVVSYYRGDELPEGESVMMPQSFATILSVTHVHAFSQPMLFGLLALVYLFSSASEKNKATLFILLFIGCFVSNSTAWLIRYVSGSFVYLFPASQLLIFICVSLMSYKSLRELWFEKK